MQPLKELIDSHKHVDQWGYRTNPCDKVRREKILQAALHFMPEPNYKRALDIGACEGFISEVLPAQDIYGFEISPYARARFPKNVQECNEPWGKYDLVVATGVLYRHYMWQFMLKMVENHSSDTFIYSGIEAWELPQITHQTGEAAFLKGKLAHEERFQYREYTQHLMVFKL